MKRILQTTRGTRLVADVVARDRPPNKAVEPTPSSVRCAPASRRGSPLALHRERAIAVQEWPRAAGEGRGVTVFWRLHLAHRWRKPRGKPLHLRCELVIIYLTRYKECL